MGLDEESVDLGRAVPINEDVRAVLDRLDMGDGREGLRVPLAPTNAGHGPRKGLTDADMAWAGGWRSANTLRVVCQHQDRKVAKVVLHFGGGQLS